VKFRSSGCARRCSWPRPRSQRQTRHRHQAKRGIRVDGGGERMAARVRSLVYVAQALGIVTGGTSKCSQPEARCKKSSARLMSTSLGNTTSCKQSSFDKRLSSFGSLFSNDSSAAAAAVLPPAAPLPQLLHAVCVSLLPLNGGWPESMSIARMHLRFLNHI
jgi:hypothetical protein